jgi:hypothetical protein
VVVQDVVGLVAGSGFAAGLNLYATALLLGLYGRWFAPDVVPEVLTSGPVLTVAAVLAAVEFVADKIPWFDSVWDTAHLVVRPAGAAVLALVLLDGDTAALSGLEAGGIAGGLAFVAHAAKASTRVAVNTSPEPVSNSIVSLLEDGAVAGIVWLAVENPQAAAVVVAVLAVLAVLVVIALFRLVRGVRDRFRGRSLQQRRLASRRRV